MQVQLRDLGLAPKQGATSEETIRQRLKLAEATRIRREREEAEARRAIEAEAKRERAREAEAARTREHKALERAREQQNAVEAANSAAAAERARHVRCMPPRAPLGCTACILPNCVECVHIKLVCEVVMPVGVLCGGL